MLYASDVKYALICIKDFNTQAVLSYADRDVTIKGTSPLIDTPELHITEKIYDYSFKKGWNYLIINCTASTRRFITLSKQPEDFKWAVVSMNKLEADEVLYHW